MLKSLIILGLSLTFAGCATTSTQTTSTAPNNKETKVTKEENEDQKYICRRTKPIGSHFAKRQCWTAEEYAERKKQDRETLEYLRDQQLNSPLPVADQ